MQLFEHPSYNPLCTHLCSLVKGPCDDETYRAVKTSSSLCKSSVQRKQERLDAALYQVETTVCRDYDNDYDDGPVPDLDRGNCYTRLFEDRIGDPEPAPGTAARKLGKYPKLREVHNFCPSEKW